MQLLKEGKFGTEPTEAAWALSIKEILNKGDITVSQANECLRKLRKDSL